MIVPEPDLLPHLDEPADVYAHMIDAHGQTGDLFTEDDALNAHGKFHAGDTTIEANGHKHEAAPTLPPA